MDMEPLSELTLHTQPLFSILAPVLPAARQDSSLDNNSNNSKLFKLQKKLDELETYL